VLAYFLTRGPSSPPELTSAEEYLSRGRTATNAGYEEAADWFRQGVERYPEHFELRVHLAMALDYGASEGADCRGLSVPLHGISAERVALAREALSEYEKARQLLPNHPEPFARAGNLYTAWGLHEDALIELERAFLLGERDEHYLDMALDLVHYQKAFGDSSIYARAHARGAADIAFPESTLIPARQEFAEYAAPISP
jgi:tetratricopeptide (TPR) repeat protein